MAKINRKKLAVFLIAILSIVVIASTIPVTGINLLENLKFPLNLFTLVVREVRGIVFYHQNLLENLRFKKENGFLQSRIVELNELYFENERLKKIISFKQQPGYKLIPARVIGRDPSNWSSVILIDKGKRQNIRVGEVVITSLGLAGRVVEVGAAMSKALLINDPNVSVSAIIQRSRQDGLVSGTLQDNLIMRYLPYDADVNTGDLIITSGLTATYPKGLLIGTVIRVASDYSGLSRYCVIKPAVDLSSLEEVLVIVR